MAVSGSFFSSFFSSSLCLVLVADRPNPSSFSSSSVVSTPLELAVKGAVVVVDVRLSGDVSGIFDDNFLYFFPFSVVQIHHSSKTRKDKLAEKEKVECNSDTSCFHPAMSPEDKIFPFLPTTTTTTPHTLLLLFSSRSRLSSLAAHIQYQNMATLVLSLDSYLLHPIINIYYCYIFCRQNFVPQTFLIERET